MHEMVHVKDLTVLRVAKGEERKIYMISVGTRGTNVETRTNGDGS